jgi:dihydrofolate synthase/folylpolyglutamate synthase
VLYPAPPLEAATLAWDHSIVEGHRVPLAGAHQVENLATAWEVIRRLGLPEARAWDGIARTVWPGRLWPVPGLPGVTMDGAHNLDGARRLADHAVATGVHPHVVFGAMGDKDLAGMRVELLRMAPASVTLVRGENPRYATADALRGVWGGGHGVLDIPAAARFLRSPREGRTLVCGSLYFMGDLLQALGITP